MEGFFQASGAVLITLILCLSLGSQNTPYGSMLSMFVCAMVLILGLHYLQPVGDFLRDLESLGNLPGEMVTILLKTTLIGMLTEITCLLCTDGGKASLAQALRIVGTAVILWLSLPVFRGMLDLIQRILEGI